MNHPSITDASPPGARPLRSTEKGSLSRAMRQATDLVERIPSSVIALAARVFPAAVFWQSGQTKLEGWSLSESAIALFQEEYKLPLIDPTLAAYLATIAEHLFPVLLVIGLATRLSAAALLIMTAVIQIFVYPSAWPTHGVWATCFLILIARGPGVLSLDHALFGRKATR